MLDANMKQQISAYLEYLKHPVQITAFLDDSEVSNTVRDLLADIDEASPRVRLVEGVRRGERVPSFGIHRPEEEPRVFFAGAPLGHELTSFVLALLHVGGHAPKIEPDVLAHMSALRGSHRFETYFSQSCQNCPDVVQALNLLAARNPGVTHVAIDGGAFEAEVAERQIRAVPAVFLDGEPFAQGRMGVEELLAKLDTGAAARRTEALARKEIFDVLVVGGGPAGAAAAIYAARKGIRTGLLAERFGGQLLDTLGIENFISVTETEGPKFASALEAHVSAYPVDVMKHQRAVRLEPGELIDVELESGATLRARSVVLATGARWRSMNVPGEEEYRTRGVTYCPHCDGPLFKGKRVAVIGGGNSGVEAAIDLAGIAAHVTLLEFTEALKADDVLQRKLRSLPNVTVVTRARTTEIVGNGTHVTGLCFEDRASGETKHLDVEGVFVQIGLLPNTGWLDGVLELTPLGEIVTDARGQTSVPGVFAAGDATTVPFKQIIIATGDGAKAALGAFEHLIRVTAPAA